MIKKRGVFSNVYTKLKQQCLGHQQYVSQPISNLTPGKLEKRKTYNFESKQKIKSSLSTKKQIKNQLNIEKQNSQIQYQDITKLTQQNRHLKQKLFKLKKSSDDRVFHYEDYINELKQNLKIQQLKIKKYEDSIKYTIMWLIQGFAKLSQSTLDDFKKYFVKSFGVLSQYLQYLGIQNKLKSLVHLTQSKSHKIIQDIDFPSKDISLEMLSLTSINSLQQTFNISSNSHLKIKQENVINSQLLAAKLFKNNQIEQQPKNSQIHIQQQQQQLKHQENSTHNDSVQAMVKKDYHSETQNYLNIKEGQKVILLRKVGAKLWIGELGDKIGYIDENFLQMKC